MNTVNANKGSSKDSWALFFSFVAIAISLIGIYLQFFYVKIGLNAAVLRPTIDRDTFFVVVNFFNPGNRMTILSDASLALQTNTDPIKPQFKSFNITAFQQVAISPGEIKAITLSIPLSLIPPFRDEYEALLARHDSIAAKGRSMGLRRPPPPPPPPWDDWFGLSHASLEEWRIVEKFMDKYRVAVDVLAMSFDGKLYRTKHVVASRGKSEFNMEDTEMFQVITENSRVQR